MKAGLAASHAGWTKAKTANQEQLVIFILLACIYLVLRGFGIDVLAPFWR